MCPFVSSPPSFISSSCLCFLCFLLSSVLTHTTSSMVLLMWMNSNSICIFFLLPTCCPSCLPYFHPSYLLFFLPSLTVILLPSLCNSCNFLPSCLYSSYSFVLTLPFNFLSLIPPSVSFLSPPFLFNFSIFQSTYLFPFLLSFPPHFLYFLSSSCFLSPFLSLPSDLSLFLFFLPLSFKLCRPLSATFHIFPFFLPFFHFFSSLPLSFPLSAVDVRDVEIIPGSRVFTAAFCIDAPPRCSTNAPGRAHVASLHRLLIPAQQIFAIHTFLFFFLSQNMQHKHTDTAVFFSFCEKWKRSR